MLLLPGSRLISLRRRSDRLELVRVFRTIDNPSSFRKRLLKCLRLFGTEKDIIDFERLCPGSVRNVEGLSDETIRELCRLSPFVLRLLLRKCSLDDFFDIVTSMDVSVDDVNYYINRLRGDDGKFIIGMIDRKLLRREHHIDKVLSVDLYDRVLRYDYKILRRCTQLSLFAAHLEKYELAVRLFLIPSSETQFGGQTTWIRNLGKHFGTETWTIHPDSSFNLFRLRLEDLLLTRKKFDVLRRRSLNPVLEVVYCHYDSMYRSMIRVVQGFRWTNQRGEEECLKNI
jgi:hypothetical protein